MDKYTGKRLDKRYEIHELIGVGGMAVVYKAYDITEDKIVAIKILKDEFLDNKEFIRRFKNESKAIAVLSDTNIVKVFDVSFGTKIQYIVMEYIDGITLKEYIGRQKNINWQDALFFTKQILNGLKHAHNKGIIHRDIKPQNIMLLKNGSIKVTDFGIARFSHNDTQTMTDRAIGSVHYIAPEQAKGGVTDEKADIYSVGVLLYEMLTGKLPFEADNAVSVAIMQMQTKPTPPREINKNIPEGLEEITLHAMAKNPLNRYINAEEMTVDIEKFQNNPSARFEYKYFSDDNPTKYVEAINSVKNEYSSEKREKSKSNKATAIVSGIAVGIIIAAGILLSISIFSSCENSFVKDVDVPNLIGLKLEDIQNDKKYNFKWKIESVYDSTKIEGVVVDQVPPSGSKRIKEGAVVTLKINSTGVLIDVPSIKGFTEEMAKSRLQNAGLKSETLMVVDNEIEKGLVKSSDPAENSKVTINSTVRLYVSKGPEEVKVVVPDVIGKKLEDAKLEILTKKLKVDKVVYEDSDKLKDVVISTTPLPSVSVPIESDVKIFVSSGNKREKTVDILVELPKTVDSKITLTASIVDGDVIVTKDVIPSDNSNFSFSVKGKTGKKTINVRLENKLYRTYEIDFDASSNNLKKIASYDFVQKSGANNTPNEDNNRVPQYENESEASEID
ncbi:protein kinase [Clostridia bacterium]|nr:protein kinase [Clostridia bacterium]